MAVNEVTHYGDPDQARGRSRGPDGVPEGRGEGRSMTATAYDPATAPEWAREPVTRTAREHPGNLPFVLGHVAEIEDARRYLAAHPPVRPDPPEDPREYLHLLAVGVWRALASGQPALGVDPVALNEGIRAACGGSDPIDELCEGWLDAAREHGIAVDDDNGDTLLATVIPVITAAFWSGLTTGHYALTRECSTPRRFLPYFERAATGSRCY
jgi:hypothetical protein